jgi:hypothetical protein
MGSEAFGGARVESHQREEAEAEAEIEEIEHGSLQRFDAGEKVTRT